MVVDGLKLAVELVCGGFDGFDGCRGPRLALELGLDEPGASRPVVESAKGQAQLLNSAAFVDLDKEARVDATDVELAAFGNFVGADVGAGRR